MTFEITDKEIEQAKETLLISKNPLKFKVFPKKEKRKYILICMLIDLFDQEQKYSEFEINDIIREVHPDFATLRRYLVDYQLLARTDDCRSYWLNVNKTDYQRFL